MALLPYSLTCHCMGFGYLFHIQVISAMATFVYLFSTLLLRLAPPVLFHCFYNLEILMLYFAISYFYFHGFYVFIFWQVLTLSWLLFSTLVIMLACCYWTLLTIVLKHYLHVQPVHFIYPYCFDSRFPVISSTFHLQT